MCVRWRSPYAGTFSAAHLSDPRDFSRISVRWWRRRKWDRDSSNAKLNKHPHTHATPPHTITHRMDRRPDADRASRMRRPGSATEGGTADAAAADSSYGRCLSAVGLATPARTIGGGAGARGRASSLPDACGAGAALAFVASCRLKSLRRQALWTSRAVALALLCASYTRVTAIVRSRLKI